MKTRIKKIIGYLGVLIATTSFAVFIDGKIGWFFLTVLILAPLLSFLGAMITAKSLSIQTDVDKTMMYKNEKTTLTVNLKSDFLFPIAFIKAKLFTSGRLIPDDDNLDGNVITVLSPTSQMGIGVGMDIRKTYRADLWGIATLGVEYLTVHDFMGFFAFKVYQERGLKDYGKRIEICPDIPEITDETGLMRYIAQAVFFDDSEETKESHSLTGGVPGYDHREYQAGDPIKRINWKLSSKRDNLMVRLDDKVVSSKQIIILDWGTSSREGLSPEMVCELDFQDQLIVEGMLGVATELLKCEIGCIFSVLTNGNFETTEISSVDELNLFRTSLSAVELFPTRAHSRLDDKILGLCGKDAPILIFTALADKRLAGEESNLGGACGGIITIAPKKQILSNPKLSAFSDLRLIDSNYNITVD